jgi:DNA adenine methylase
MAEQLKAPFPFFGGKRAVASLIWQRLGDPDNFIEPFMGSAAVLLCRPHPPRVETVNDKDVMIANFWRATQFDPEQVAYWADWPVDECCMHANHRWLVLSDDAAAFRQKMRTDPDYYDCRVAGKWVHGLCCWIGGGWTVDPEHGAAHGAVNGSGERSAKPTKANGLRQKMPVEHVKGVHGNHRPQLADAYARGRGVHGNDAADHYLSGGKKLPLDRHGTSTPALAGTHGYGQGVVNLNGPADGTCASRRAWLVDWFSRLRDRLRTVRVCCGSWERVCDSESVTTRLGMTGIFFDPPYLQYNDKGEESRSGGLYATDGSNNDLIKIRDELLTYCLERGPNPKMRLCVAAYQGDGYEQLLEHGWEEVAWRAAGGYGNRSAKGKKNAGRERLYFSPNCIKGQAGLFDGLE